MRTKKRRGGFLVDVLLGMMILLLGILPLAASISFAYRTLTGSVGMTMELNRRVYDDIDREILECTFDDLAGTATAAFLGGFDQMPVPPADVGTISSDYGTSPAILRYKPINDVSFDNRGSVIKIYVVKK